MIFLDLINMRKIRKAVIYGFCIILAQWLQLMVLSRLEILGAKPFFLPALIVAFGFFEGGVWGAVLGMVTGAYCDMVLVDSTALFLVLYAAIGFFSGVLADYLLNRKFFSYMAVATLALLLTAFCQIVPLWIFAGSAFLPLFTTALLQTLWSLPPAALCYFVVKRVSGKERLR